MLEGDRPLQRADDVDLLPLRLSDPVRELHCVRHRGAEQYDVTMLGQHDQHLLPHYAAL